MDVDVGYITMSALILRDYAMVCSMLGYGML